MSKRRTFIAAGLVLLALSLLALTPYLGMSHFTGVGIAQPTEVGTATPALLRKFLRLIPGSSFRSSSAMIGPPLNCMTYSSNPVLRAIILQYEAFHPSNYCRDRGFVQMGRAL